MRVQVSLAPERAVTSDQEERLKQFAADRVKIDRSFVTGLPDDRFDRAIVEAMIRMAHDLDLEVTAEGVESTEQAAFLRRREDRRPAELARPPDVVDEGGRDELLRLMYGAGSLLRGRQRCLRDPFRTRKLIPISRRPGRDLASSYMRKLGWRSPAPETSGWALCTFIRMRSSS